MELQGKLSQLTPLRGNMGNVADCLFAKQQGTRRRDPCVGAKIWLRGGAAPTGEPTSQLVAVTKCLHQGGKHMSSMCMYTVDNTLSSMHGPGL
ncbi:hypothetical protein E2562_024013 [Oryza meyeriana var. granulata]|uniref:Uncharacterized protein n=1 Tax=Oryza meyeriana var. granulata TaxID=110450 RepID=A0A6G1ECB7_9ORYZ|nr:hypothetical protein E2562_024013 [Oryza meyeriana var. granulata]